MLLAAGFGKRMLPLTLAMPKPAVPVLGRPIVMQALSALASDGVEHVVVNLHHLPDYLPTLIGEDAPGIPAISYSPEPEILGTAGALRQARPLFRGDGPLVVTNGDFLADIPLQEVLRAHRESGHAATLVLAPPRSGYSKVLRDEGGRIVSLAGRPDPPSAARCTEHLFTGFHIVGRQALERIPAEGPSNIVTDVYVDLAREGRLGSYLHEGFWWEFGDPSLYWEGSMRMLDLYRETGKRVSDHDPVQEIGDAIAAVGAGARWDATSELRGRVAVGFAAQVGRGALLEETLVMPEAWVGPGARLSRSVVAAGVEVPIDFEAADSLIVADEKTPGKLSVHPLQRLQTA